jgi:hypothetical protein
MNNSSKHNKKFRLGTLLKQAHHQPKLCSTFIKANKEKIEQKCSNANKERAVSVT